MPEAAQAAPEVTSLLDLAIPSVEFTELFAADILPRRIPIPVPSELPDGTETPECWVEIRKMNAHEYTSYMQCGQVVQLRNGRLVEDDMDISVTLNVAEQEMTLLLSCVEAIRFFRRKQALNEDGTVVIEIVETPNSGIRNSERVTAQKREFHERIFKELTPAFRSWLVALCRAECGLTEIAVKPSASSLPS